MRGRSEAPSVGADDMFETAVRSAEDRAGVFEFDGETGYFYLYDMTSEEGQILNHIHIMSGKHDLLHADVQVRWSDDEQMVGLFIRGDLWAVFVLRVEKRAGTTGLAVGRISPKMPNADLLAEASRREAALDTKPHSAKQARARRA